MASSESTWMTVALVFADKQIFVSLAPLIVGPSLWVAALIFSRFNQLRQSVQQAVSLLDRVEGRQGFFRQLVTLDTVIGSLPAISDAWCRFRKDLVMPREDAATPFVRSLKNPSIYFHEYALGPRKCVFFREIAVKVTLITAIVLACCSLAAAVFLSVSGLTFQATSAGTEVVGIFQHGFIQSGAVTVTLFVLAGIVMVILLENFGVLAERLQAKYTSELSEKLCHLTEEISPVLMAYEHTHEVKQQTQYLCLIEKRLSSLENKLARGVQQNVIKPSLHSSSAALSGRGLSVPPNLRSELSRFRDPLEDTIEGSKKLTTNGQSRLKDQPLMTGSPASETPSNDEKFKEIGVIKTD